MRAREREGARAIESGREGDIERETGGMRPRRRWEAGLQYRRCSEMSVDG